MESKLGHTLVRRLRNIYKVPPVQKFVRFVGMDEFIIDAYRYFLYQFSPDEYTLSVADVSADFEISSPEIARHFPTGEQHIIEDLLENMRDDDVFWDVGAHVGMFACLAGQAMENGEVVAFEPYPPTYESLQNNVENNELNINLQQIALSDENGEVSFFHHTTQAGTTGRIDPEDSGRQTVEVPERTGDYLINNESYTEPDILKIDVEGGELDVLTGLEDTLREGKCRLIYCEVHPNGLGDLGNTPDEVERLITDTGFEIINRFDEGKRYIIKATR